MDRPAVVPVGTVGRAHGVRGWVRVRSDMDPPEDLLRHDTWLVECAGGRWRPVAVRSARAHGNAFVAHFEGAEDRDAAAELAGTRVGLPAMRCRPWTTGSITGWTSSGSRCWMKLENRLGWCGR